MWKLSSDQTVDRVAFQINVLTMTISKIGFNTTFNVLL